MIRKAHTYDVDTLMSITSACAKHLISKGVFQWNEHYPNSAAFYKDIKRDELYVYDVNGTIMGCVTISKVMDDDYIEVDWLTPNQDNLYIHRLAVHPKHQGKGLAQELMDFAEDLAIKTEAPSVRLDTFSKNQRNQKFYELRGYQKLGVIYFPKQSEHPFYCYELIL
ncbi:GNAT family N-acetyltransferase [Sediminibacter sp. Hel_I_10]|uniref:GNAT family N-acetyltransferase n=1 Tax=Sediminibacter sp. Hel_I_10 TaxID=1392490 RepID=UPI00047D7D02|nr:GNAT family N-acetyltransferase [Sediminibacter sp. Hel_I_10]